MLLSEGMGKVSQDMLEQIRVPSQSKVKKHIRVAENH
jgi:hypothetical protein